MLSFSPKIYEQIYHICDKQTLPCNIICASCEANSEIANLDTFDRQHNYTSLAVGKIQCVSKFGVEPNGG
jgi:hypothetical protein